jgi:hypothetical protein
MSRPQFPDPLGRRELNVPGATAHKAGLTLEDRVKALEQGAAGRPGPDVSNGSVITSDTTQTGGVKWAKSPALAYRMMAHSSCHAFGLAAGDYFLAAHGLPTTGAHNGLLIDLRSAEQALTNMTATLRLKAFGSCNATASNVDLTVKLQRVTASGGGGGVTTYTLSATSLSCGFTSAAGTRIAANDTTRGPITSTATFDSTNFPDGLYVLTLTVGAGGVAANSVPKIGTFLEIVYA